MKRAQRKASATLMPVVTAAVIASRLLAGAATIADESRPDQPVPQMKLWKEIALGQYHGSFPCLGDLDGDSQVDLLLYRQGPQTAPAYLVALSHDGQKLWEMGEASIQTRTYRGRSSTTQTLSIASASGPDERT